MMHNVHDGITYVCLQRAKIALSNMVLTTCLLSISNIYKLCINYKRDLLRVYKTIKLIDF